MTSGEMFRVELANVHYFTSPPQRTVSQRTSDPTAELIVMLSGEYRAVETVLAKRRDVVARAGDVVYWPPRTMRVEENDPVNPTRCISIYFRWEDAATDIRRITHDSDHLIRMLAEKEMTLKDSGVVSPPGVANAYLAAMLAELVRRSHAATNQLSAKVAEFVEENMARPFTIVELASSVALNKHHFGRKYKTLTGHTPMQEVRRIRCEHAKRMLRSIPRVKLSLVAERVGVRDAHQLCRMIKKTLGISVRDLRK